MKTRNRQLDIIKAFLIFSVICAHTLSDAPNVSRLLQMVGLIGVPCFFAISSYFFHKYYVKGKPFWKKKFKYLVLPWILFGTVTYIINSCVGSEKEGISILNWVLYMIGYQSHLYYLSILMLFYFLSCLLYDNKVFIFLEKISIVFALGYGIYTDVIGVKNVMLYPYLNPIFWFGFWGLGARRDWKPNTKWCALAFLALTVCVWFFGKSYLTYFSCITVIWEIVCVMFCLSWGIDSASATKIPMLERVGKSTLFIYLSHIVVIGLANIVINQDNLLDLLKPVFVFALYMIGLLLLEMVSTPKMYSIYRMAGISIGGEKRE